ncbi:MAG: hypothetical protein UT33_C0006G0022 [Candidatus Peregrinibacteria bacterium GW2011_GWC2_39_14]|nr:MAG: hypothetical protein UT33_C0006G0022 [Candidatus Peregrinibacteria bacterium GW2011_GWC2_39_14]
MQKTRILGIDFGLKRIGVAISDSDCKIALPRDPIENNGYDGVLEEIASICDENLIKAIVLGYPVGFKGERTNIIEKVDDFCARLKDELNITVILEDERYTTVQAHKYMNDAGIRKSRKQGLKDSISATIFLQVYLDKLNAELN